MPYAEEVMFQVIPVFSGKPRSSPGAAQEMVQIPLPHPWLLKTAPAELNQISKLINKETMRSCLILGSEKTQHCPFFSCKAQEE